MVASFTETGDNILNELKSKNRILLEERPVSDYYSGQGPENPIIPVFYDRVIKELTHKYSDLVKIKNRHFKMKLYNKKLQFLVAIIKRR